MRLAVGCNFGEVRADDFLKILKLIRPRNMMINGIKHGYNSLHIATTLSTTAWGTWMVYCRKLNMSRMRWIRDMICYANNPEACVHTESSAVWAEVQFYLLELRLLSRCGLRGMAGCHFHGSFANFLCSIAWLHCRIRLASSSVSASIFSIKWSQLLHDATIF